MRREDLNRELDEELQFHIDARVRDNLNAGMTEEAAPSVPRMIWASITLKGEAGAGFIITSCSRPSLTSSFWFSTCAPKKTFGVTWEQILRAIQPWLVREKGYCSSCGTQFELGST
jgi:hypothetical protein